MSFQRDLFWAIVYKINIDSTSSYAFLHGRLKRFGHNAPNTLPELMISRHKHIIGRSWEALTL